MIYQIFSFFKLIFDILRLLLRDIGGGGDNEGWLEDEVTVSDLTTSDSQSTDTVGISVSELGALKTSTRDIAVKVVEVSTLLDDPP